MQLLVWEYILEIFQVISVILNSSMQCFSCIILSFAGSHHWDFSYFSSSNTLSKYTRRVCFTVQIASDHIHEEDEEFEVVLEGRSLPDYATITSDVARVKIINVRVSSC